MRTVDIPGGKAVLREHADLRVKHRRLVENASLAASEVLSKIPELPKGLAELPPEETVKVVSKLMKDVELSRRDANLLSELSDALIASLLVSWTLNSPVPQTVEDVQEMEPEVYDALKDTVSGFSMTKKSFAPNPDVQSPTSPSSDSAGSWREETAP